MKKLVLAVSMLAFGTAGAFAADLAARPYTKAPAMLAPAPIISWAGFYVGGEGGYAWGRDSANFTDFGTTSGGFDTSGGVAGGVVGYNWQAPGSNWVFGLEGNFDWANINGSTTPCPNPSDTCKSNLNEIFTGTGRIGYAVNNMLFYAKGGYAWTNDRFYGVDIATGAEVETTPRTGRDGYTLGAGLEYMFAPNWSAKAEYDYYNFGAKATNGNFVPSGGFAEHITLSNYSVNSIKGGINYHFNWGGPVVAKY